MTMGSGSLAAMSIFEHGYTENLKYDPSMIHLYDPSYILQLQDDTAHITPYHMLAKRRSIDLRSATLTRAC